MGGIVYPNGEEAVVVAGGRDLNTVEIFFPSSMEWREGPDLPASDRWDAGMSVPFGNTFLIVGGEADGDISDRIIKYDVDNDDWIELPQTLTTARADGAAFLVPDNYVTCT